MNLLPNWKSILKTSYTVQAAVAGLALPEVLQLVADHTDFIPWLDDDYKQAIRMVSLALIPFVRVIQQPKLAQPASRDGA